MIEATLGDIKSERLEGDCKELIISGYVNHREDLVRLPEFPTGAIVIGENWSYSAKIFLGKSDLNLANPIMREVRKRKIDSIQYVNHFADDQGNLPNFESIVLAHLQIPPATEPKYMFDYLFEFRKFLSLFLIGDRRLMEAEIYQKEWHSKRLRMSASDLQHRILFLYDSQLNDKGVINLYQ